MIGIGMQLKGGNSSGRLKNPRKLLFSQIASKAVRAI